VSRNVDVGQTVAASLQAPTLFTIANDLTKMQVLASIDEADVGQIKEGIKADFTVDAFPGETFSGDIIQIRLNAQTQQNVVTYTAVIEVSNPQLKLRPGMTANITVPIAQRENVLTVPNAALRFRPNLSDKEQEELRQRMEARRASRENERGENRGGDRPARSEKQQTSSEDPGGGEGPRRQGQMVWIFNEAGKLETRFIRTGLTNGRVTEVVSGDLNEGDIIVTGQETNDRARPQQPGSPFGQRPPGGGGRFGPRGR
jgi:HlyD family secretion protein